MAPSRTDEFVDDPILQSSRQRSDSNESSKSNDSTAKISSNEGAELVKRDMEFFLARLERTSSLSSN